MDDIERRVLQVLDGLGVAYKVVPIDPAYADTAEFCAHYDVPLEHAANTIVVGSKKEPRRYSACVVKATTRLDVNHTVFALPPDLPVYVDDKLLALPWVILGSGSRSSKIRTSPAIFKRLPNAVIVSGLSIEA